MTERKRLDFSKLNLHPSTETYEEATKDALPLSNEALNALRDGNIKTKKDVENRCVKLGTSY